MHQPLLRAATAGDTGVVLDLLRLMGAEAPFGAFSDRKAVAQIEACLASGAVLLSLSIKDQIPVATTGLSVAQPWWCEEPVLQEVWTFVHPEHRRAPHARRLLGLARDIARGLRMPLLASVLSTRRTAGKVRLYQREFGAPAGAMFLIGEV